MKTIEILKFYSTIFPLISLQKIAEVGGSSPNLQSAILLLASIIYSSSLDKVVHSNTEKYITDLNFNFEFIRNS